MRIVWRAVLVLFALLVAVGFHADGWETETRAIGSEGEIGWFPDFSIGPDGGRDFAYCRFGDAALVYVTDRGGWSSRVVDHGCSVNDTVSVAAGPDGTPRILYTVSTPETGGRQLVYVRLLGSGWTRVPIAAIDGDISRYDLAVDSSGRAHVVWASFLFEEIGPVRYVRISGLDVPGAIETVDAHGSYPAIAVDASGAPHVAYVSGDYTDTRMTYRRRDATFHWSFRTDLASFGFVPDPGYYLFRAGIAVDGNGDAHVVWARREGSGSALGVYYAAHGSAGWSAAARISDSGSRPTVTAAGDIVHVAFCGGGSVGYCSALWYGSGTPEELTSGTASLAAVVTAEPDYAIGSSPTIAVDAFGAPHIASLEGLPATSPWTTALVETIYTADGSTCSGTLARPADPAVIAEVPLDLHLDASPAE